MVWQVVPVEPPMTSNRPPTEGVGRSASQSAFCPRSLKCSGGLPKRSNGSDCKSDGLGLRRFESYTPHSIERSLEEFEEYGRQPSVSRLFEVG